MYLENGKVYRFHYTDANDRDRGTRTALFLGDNGAYSTSGLSYKFLDLDKGEPRNFVPNRMESIKPVTCEVGYVNVGKLSPALYDGLLKTYEGSGYSVFRDGDHVNLVKGWQKPKDVELQSVSDGFFVKADAKGPISNTPPVGVYYRSGQLRVWTAETATWKQYETNLAGLRALYVGLREYLKTREDE